MLPNGHGESMSCFGEKAAVTFSFNFDQQNGLSVLNATNTASLEAGKVHSNQSMHDLLYQMVHCIGFSLWIFT
jgi:hypothetical protein